MRSLARHCPDLRGNRSHASAIPASIRRRLSPVRLDIHPGFPIWSSFSSFCRAIPSFFGALDMAVKICDEVYEETGDILKADQVVYGLPGATPGFTHEDLT